MINIIKSSV